MSAPAAGDAREHPPLVMIHGWGLHGGVWAGLAAVLGQTRRVLTPDLPGHGGAPCLPEGFGLAAAADALAPGMPDGSTVLGWSLGALVALTLARRHPRRVGELVLVAATPRFTRGADWPCAVDAAVLEGFARDLEDDHRQTLTRFLALQVRGGTAPRDTLRTLRTLLFERGEPDPSALAGGLEALRKTDMRSEVADIMQPAVVIAGERDRLVPAEASRRLAAALPRARYALVPGAAHAPFLSHPGAFAAALGDAAAHPAGGGA